MIRLEAMRHPVLYFYCAGSRPTMTTLVDPSSSIAAMSFDLPLCDAASAHESADPARRSLDRPPNEPSTRLSNRPPASKSP
jgi:hypothetical protein